MKSKYFYYIILVLTIASIIFISGCVEQEPTESEPPTSTVNVPAGAPKVDIIVGKPFDDHGLPSLNVTLKIEGASDDIMQYQIWVRNPSGRLGPNRYDIPKEDMADGIEDIVMELDDSFVTPTPGTYQLVIFELTQQWNEREISRKSLGTFAGADLKVLEWGPPKYTQIAFPCCAYSINRVPMKFRNDGDLPAYPLMILNIDGTWAYSNAFTEGEKAGESGIWGRGVSPGETVNGYMPYSDWRGRDDGGFSSGSHSIKYTIYHTIYRGDVDRDIQENITTYTEAVSFTGR